MDDAVLADLPDDEATKLAEFLIAAGKWLIERQKKKHGSFSTIGPES